MKNVLVLGSTGMLGSMVEAVLRRNERISILATTRSTFEAETFATQQDHPSIHGVDYIVNCIGVIKPHCKDDDAEGVRQAIAVNALFPHILARAADRAGARVIQIATDCVYSGTRGQYGEMDPHDPIDVYGKSKSLGEVRWPHFLNIRCSIIGPEMGRCTSLFEWFMSQPEGGSVSGFAHHLWNGVTTLQYAELVERIITTPNAFDEALSLSHLHHFVPNTTVSKFELLTLMAKHFDKNVAITKVSDTGPSVDRTLRSNLPYLSSLYPSVTMEDAIAAMKRYMPMYKAALTERV